MYRTFHYRVTFAGFVAVVLTAAAAFSFLWHRTAPNVIIGFMLVFAAMLMIERMIHTEYTFTPEGMLVIRRGRFSRTLSVPVNEILRAEVVRHRLLPVRYVLIEYGAGHEVSVQPVGEDAFLRELRKRQEQFDI